MTVEMSLVPMTWGTDESIEYVLARIADQDGAEGGVLWGDQLSEGDVDAIHIALIVTGNDRLMWEFRAGCRYSLDAETTAVVFESLVDYALSESDTEYDEDYQGRASSLASGIAQIVAGAEWI